MRVKRLKKASRILTFFRYHYSYLPPYSLLLDGTFCQAALQSKINLREQVPKYVAAEIGIFTTKCVMKELEELGSELHGALVLAQQYPVAKCPHTPLRSAADCIKHLARRSKTKDHLKYFIGTQDNDLLNDLRELGGIPMMSIRYNTILLEKPSQSSMDGVAKSALELQKVRQMKVEILGETVSKKRKKPKAPNPLSCKRKKVKLTISKKTAAGEVENGRKRKRIRKKKLM